MDALTLPELLQARGSSLAIISFLDSDEHSSVQRIVTHAELYSISSALAHRLLHTGLKPQSSVVLASFSDHYSHIVLFWACVLSGIIFCPLPPLHPDRTRQKLLFDHLQSLFSDTALFTDTETAASVSVLAPALKISTLDQLPSASGGSSVYPSYKPLPGDVVCFMLTSGSTGNSKAVSLSHSNLLSSIRGKIRHHGSSSRSKFLNWIAFDHVACVSEIHLQAMEADASQWHIAPSAIITRPLRLLELSSRYGITYTFSPNFLIGQILRELNSNHQQKTYDLSSLVALISGGEAVPISTAVSFADYLQKCGAPRNTLRAGFGMSETGAGCIYDTRPIPTSVAGHPGYLSLGKVCSGVEMRVLDSSTGEVQTSSRPGILQIRGTSVFKEYFGNAKATSESFSNEWFTTGDLAQIDDGGNLWLVGREKDCLNINGVKCLPQDVVRYIEDANLDAIVPSNLFVCPMRAKGADTETYAVFYQHIIPVEEELDEAKKEQVKVTNRAITTLCTVFCSATPHIVLPLPRQRFIKTSLGKVSQVALVKAFQEGEFVHIQRSLLSSAKPISSPPDLLTPIEKVVQTSVSRVFELDEETTTNLRRDGNLFEMGASSMHLLRLKQAIEDDLGLPRDIPTIEMLKRPVIGELCDYLLSLTAKKDSITSVIYDPIVRFNSVGYKAPLFLVHPGVGEVLVFVNLARALDDERPVYALRARGFDYGDAPFDTFEEMVDSYTSAILRECPNGPYYIAGYSFGGAVAFETGKKLEKMGKEVRFVGILNLPPHIKWRMEELVWVEVLLNIGMFLSLFPESHLDDMRTDLVETFPRVKESKGKKPEGVEDIINWVFKKSDQDRLKMLNLKLEAFIRWVEVAYCINGTGRTYDPSGSVSGALMTVFCAIPLPSMGTREEFKAQRLSVWKEFSGPRFEMIDVEGAHYTMLDENNVNSFASHLRAALARADEPYPVDVQSSFN